MVSIRADLAQRSDELLDGAVEDPETKLEDLAQNPRGAPERILPRHLPDQGHCLAGQLGLTGGSGCVPAPNQAEPSAMPLPTRARGWQGTPGAPGPQ